MKNIIASTIILTSAFFIGVVDDFAWANQPFVEAEPATETSTATNDFSMSLELAQHTFSTRYIREKLNALHSHQERWRRTPSFAERFTVLSECVYGLKQCVQALGYLFNPSRQDSVDLVCLEINASDTSENWSGEFVNVLAKENYPFAIQAAGECSQETITDRTYKLSVSFSDCSGQICSARTYVKRIREWCGTGWKTNKYIQILRGIKFEVLEGLETEKVTSNESQSSNLTLNPPN
jgi:hypothetical protein